MDVWALPKIELLVFIGAMALVLLYFVVVMLPIIKAVDEKEARKPKRKRDDVYQLVEDQAKEIGHLRLQLQAAQMDNFNLRKALRYRYWHNEAIPILDVDYTETKAHLDRMTEEFRQILSGASSRDTVPDEPVEWSVDDITSTFRISDVFKQEDDNA